MAEYDRRFPENRSWRAWLRAGFDRLRMWRFRRAIHGLPAGSPRWHRWQEKLSQDPSVGFHLARRNEFYMRTLPGCGPLLCVFPGTILCFPTNVEFGRNVFVNRHVYVVAPALVRIGDNVLIGPYVSINSGAHRYADPEVPIRDQGHDHRPIVIGPDAWIGSHATILPGVTVGRGAVVGAGAVVTRDVAPFSVVGGVPARFIKWRKKRDI